MEATSMITKTTLLAVSNNYKNLTDDCSSLPKGPGSFIVDVLILRYRINNGREGNAAAGSGSHCSVVLRVGVSDGLSDEN
jgi:hypothetical protein